MCACITNIPTQGPNNLRHVWTLAQILLGLTLLAENLQGLFTIFTDASLPFTFCSYLLPITICLFSSVKLQPGPWDLRRWGPTVRTGAALFLMLLLFLVVVPQSYPITLAGFPYTPVIWIFGMLCLMVIWYLPRIGGRHFYTGPVSANAGSVKFAIASPILTPSGIDSGCLTLLSNNSPCMFSMQEVHEAAFEPTRSAPSVSQIAASVCSKREEALDAERVHTHWLWHHLVSRPWKWLLPGRKQVVSFKVKPSGSSYSSRGGSITQQHALRIPGEMEALTRAKNAPIHPTGYAWDVDASKRMEQRKLSAKKLTAPG